MCRAFTHLESCCAFKTHISKILSPTQLVCMSCNAACPPKRAHVVLFSCPCCSVHWPSLNITYIIVYLILTYITNPPCSYEISGPGDILWREARCPLVHYDILFPGDIHFLESILWVFAGFNILMIWILTGLFLRTSWNPSNS